MIQNRKRPGNIGPVERILYEQVSIPLSRPNSVSAGEVLAVLLGDVAPSSDGNDPVVVPGCCNIINWKLVL